MGTKISKVSSKLKNTEVQSVSSELHSAYQASSIQEYVPIQGLFAELGEKVIAITQAIHATSDKITLVSRDAIRDEAYRAAYYLCYGLTFHPDEAIAAVAKRVFAIYEGLGLRIVYESYAIESALIESLLSDIETSIDNEDLLLMSGMTEQVGILKQAQEAFREETLELVDEQNEQSENLSASQLSKELLTLINAKILVAIEGLMIVDEDTFSDIGQLFDQIISRYNH